MSAVWKFFTKKRNNEPVSCNLCGKTYKTCGNTTNLATHLKTKHHYAYLQVVNIQNSSKTEKSSNETIDVASANFNDDDTSVDVTLPRSSTPNTKNTSNDDSQIQEIRENSVHSPKIQFFNEAAKKKKARNAT